MRTSGTARTIAGIAVLVATYACDNPTSPLAHKGVEFSSHVVWAGGTVMLYSVPRTTNGFAIFLNEQPADITTFNAGDSVLVRIPETANNLLRIEVGTPGATPVGTLSVGGLLFYGSMPADIASAPFPFLADGIAAVLYNRNFQLMRYKMGSMSEQRLLDNVNLSFAGVRMPGLTPDPRTLILARSSSVNEKWEIRSTPVFVATIPAVLFRHSAVMTNGMTVETGHHSILSFSISGGLMFSAGAGFEESQSIAISPDGHFVAVPLHFTTDGRGIPVFDTTGLPQRVPRITMSHGAVFSTNSDTLFVGGSYDERPNLRGALFVVNPRNGAVMREIDFGLDHPNRVALDPGGKWIYVATDQHEDQPLPRPPVLYIVDRHTFAIAGRIPLTEWISCSPFCDPIVVAAPDGLFVVTKDGFARFSRP